MGQHPEQEHIYALRRLRPDIHGHFVYELLPHLITSFPTLLCLAQEKSEHSKTTPILHPDTLPWPSIVAKRDYPLTPAEYTLMHALELEIERICVGGHTLHTTNFEPSLSVRRRGIPQYIASFAVTPRIDSY